MNAKPLVLVLAVAGLAIAAWFAWRGGGDAATLPAPATNQTSGESPGAADAEIGRGDVGQGPAESDAATAAARLGERTDAAGRVEAADGDAKIRGRLVDGDGRGLPGVEIGVRVVANPARSEFLGDISDGAPRLRFITRPDGRFEFGLVRDHSALLSLTDDDLVFKNSPLPVHGHKGDHDLGDVLVERSATVSGVVHDGRGSPVAGVTVTAGIGVVAFGTSSSASTGEDGRFRIGKLKPGKWTLRTASAQYLPASEDVLVEAGSRVEDVVLVVATGSAIAGQVVDDLGRPVPDFRVGAKRMESSGGIEVERFAADESAETNANGFFTLAGLAGETATVRAFGSGHTTAIATNVKVGTGNLLLKVDRLATIEGVLRGADGGPLADSRVRAVSRQDGMLASHGIEGILQDRAPGAKTAADGSFRIEGVKPGSVTVSAEGNQHRPVQRAGIQVAPAQTIQGVQLVADRGAVARLSVVDEDGNRIAGANVRAEKPPQAQASGGLRLRSRRVENNEDGVAVFDGSDALGTAVTDGEGTAVIAGLPAESIAFHAEHDDFAAARPVTLPMMQNGTVDVELTVRTPGYAELHVTAADGTPATDARYRVRGPLGASEADTENGKADAQGNAVVGPLAAGNYVAELARKSGGHDIGGAMVSFSGDAGNAIAGTEQRFRVVAGETTVVEIRRPVLTRVFGVVTGADGPVAAATIEIEKDAPSMGGAGGPMSFGGGGRTTTAGPDGSFSIEDVETGDYVLRYGRAGQIVKAEARINVPPELPELRQDLVLRTGKVRVQAWSEVEDRGIAGAQVTVSRASNANAGEPERRQTQIVMVSVSSSGDATDDSTMMTFGAQRVKTDADGQAEIDDVPVGDYDIRITHGKHAPVERKGLAVNELQTTDVGRLVMTQAGSIRGKVVASDGGAVRIAMVYYRPVDGEEGQPRPAMGGSFTIDALAPGRYVLRAQELSMGPGGAGPGASSPEVEVEVEAGKAATAELRLPAK